MRSVRLMLVVATLSTVAAVPGAGSASPGDLDPSFGIPARLDLGGNDVALDAAVDDGGRITMIGYRDDTDTAALARMTSRGLPDRTFGRNGVALIRSYRPDTWLSEIAIDRKGRILVAGSAPGTAIAPLRDLVLMRFTAAGKLDTSFGTGGVVRHDLFGLAEIPASLAVRPDGSLLAGGSAIALGDVPGAGDVGLPGSSVWAARFLPNGELDRTYGAGGATLVNADGRVNYIRSMTASRDGSVLLAGRTSFRWDGRGDVLVVRLTPAGVVDTTFGDAGAAIFDLGSDDTAAAIALSGSKMVVGANTATGLAALRLTPAGALDRTFNRTGAAIVPLAGTYTESRDVIVDRAGRIVVAGSEVHCTPFCGFTRPTMVRWTKAGRVDTGFGVSGRTIAPTGMWWIERLLPQGAKAIAAGWGFAGGAANDFLALRVAL